MGENQQLLNSASPEVYIIAYSDLGQGPITKMDIAYSTRFYKNNVFMVKEREEISLSLRRARKDCLCQKSIKFTGI